jgi:hypothetical protein
MAIRVACPSCRKEYNLAPKLAGKRVRCPACQTNIPVPGDGAVNGQAAEAAAVRTAPKAVRPAADEDVPELELVAERGAPPAKSKTLLFVLIGGGVAALLLLGCVGVGVAALMFLKLPAKAPVVAVNTPPQTATTPQPTPAPPTKPNTPPSTKPNVPPEPPPEPDEPAGPHLDADPPREPVQPLTNPSATLPLVFSVNNPVRYSWVPGPVVAVQAPKNNETVWDVWNLQSMKQLGSVKGPSGADLKISNDGAYAALNAFAPGTIRPGGFEIYTVADGKPLRTLPFKKGNDSRIGVYEFAGPGQFLSLSNEGRGGAATLYDVKTGEEVSTFKTVGQIDRKANVLSPGGRYLAMFDSFGAAHPIQVYELATGKVVRTLKPRVPQVGYFNCGALVFSPDGKELAALLTTDAGDHLQAWHFETGKRTVSHKFTPALLKTAKVAGRNLLEMYPAPLEYLPDRSGWFAYGQLMIDHDRGNIFWTQSPEDRNVVWQRRFLDADHYATVIVKAPRERQLEIVGLPRDEIEAARKK